MASVDLINKATVCMIDPQTWLQGNTYRCHILVVKEDEGYSAIVLNLPGTGSCGDTEEEAIVNAKEAIAGVIESYVEAGEDIPWTDTTTTLADIPDGAKQKWVIVDA